ncbi:DUF551 domain-containing protein [Enterobacter kobei]|uniref:DUF551 domain-containing protein n=1 Tax=Enterobacter kobei TaxID=208224 RepID=UPI000EF27B22|nr:DUF551 domain-containing protein [Enterobacter kobei]AYL05355.1 DUF551 domain-containing protein [Enterobacter kobei]MDD9222615.1 DUF551 domain-containing protein [Enterobacter kobei]
MTFTKEQLQHIIETDHVQCGDASALARMALAGMEAEPVAWAHRLINKRNGVVHPWVYGSAEACPSEGDIFNIEVMPLYTAPPAPVSVPDAMEMDDDFDSAFEHGKAVGWNACRAAMLQGVDRPQNEPQNIPENIPATQFKPVADLYGLTSPTGGETSFTFDAVEARDFIDGGWLCQEYVELERFQEAITNHTEDKLAMVDHSGDSNNMVEPVTTAYKLPDGWVACSDRMPTKNDRVLIFINFNSDTVPPSIHDAQFTGSTFRRGNATVNVFPLEDGYGVTHWMPLPAAPQQEVNNG